MPVRRFTRLLFALALTISALPAAAQASSSQLALFQDDRQLIHGGPHVRDTRLDELKALGVDVVKVQLTWARVAPARRAKPHGFKGWDLSTYPNGAFAPYDELVRAAQARGMRVLMALGPPAPGWATAQRGDAAGVWHPSAREFGRFALAVGVRYDGTRVDEQGRRLPRVGMWSIWNEPNHPQFLLPLSSETSGIPIAPRIYRGLVRYGVDGLRRAGHSGSTILFGELLPIGHSRAGARRTIKPILFLRELFCLDRAWRPYRGRAARARGCQGFRRISGVTGFAYHPYTRPDGPRGPEPTTDDATIRSIDRVTAALDRAADRGRLWRRGLRVWNTEFGYQSDPPDPFQTRMARIPGFLNEAEWISYGNGRIASWSQYGLVDDPLTNDPHDRYGLFQAALRFGDGRVKHSVYEAYRSPLLVRVRSRGVVEVWGAARPARWGSRVEIQQRLRGTRSYRTLRTITLANPRGYFRQRIRISRPERRLFRFVYDDEGSERRSRAAKALTR
jgi:hypothetical protein